MAEKKTLLGVRVTESFRKRIEAERLKRKLSVQQMVQDALEYYFKTPLDWDYAKTEFYVDDSAMTKKRIDQIDTRRRLWDAYIESIPEKKIELMAETMRLDLLHYKSSRVDAKTNKGKSSSELR